MGYTNITHSSLERGREWRLDWGLHLSSLLQGELLGLNGTYWDLANRPIVMTMMAMNTRSRLERLLLLVGDISSNPGSLIEGNMDLVTHIRG